jgi:serine protease AprX
MKNIFALVLALLSCNVTNAQYSKYIIRIKNKANSPFSINNPQAYLGAKAIARRAKFNIAIDSTDLPIPPIYVNTIKATPNVVILNQSKWLNQVLIQTTDAAALNTINNLPFVLKTAPLAARPRGFKNSKTKFVNTADTPQINYNSLVNSATNVYNYGVAFAQVNIHNGQFLHNRGYNGQGMDLAVMDGGFFNYTTLKTFDSIRINGQVKETWDFVSNNATVSDDHPHGTQCLSAIAANLPGSFVGTAPKSNFYLYRTEDVFTEYPIEEQNWIAAAERADSLGVDVFSTSLGYFDFDGGTIFDYNYAQHLNGDSTMIARATDLAAKKGILPVAAAGNEGNGSWRYIISPADADSVLAVGAINNNGVVASFSSYGPSADGQVKPTVAAVGWGAIVANPNSGNPQSGNGTSFACPNMAGLTTCLWQAFPNVSNMEIIEALKISADKFTTPDNRTGYGIPNVKKAFCYLVKQSYRRNVTPFNNCAATIFLSNQTDTGVVLTLQRKLPNQNNYVTIANYTGTTTLLSNANNSYQHQNAQLPIGNIMYRSIIKITDTTFIVDSFTVNNPAKPNLGADTAISLCPTTFNLNNNLYNTSNVQSTWYFNNQVLSNPTSVTTNGLYTLIVNNNFGCTDTAIVNLQFYPKPNLGTDKTAIFCSNKSFSLNNVFATNGLATTWRFNNATITKTDSVTQAGSYELIVKNNNNCTDTAAIILSHTAEPCYVPVEEKITISPNPANNYVQITIGSNDARNVEVMLHSIDGKKITSVIAQQQRGKHIVALPLQRLQKGLYIVTVYLNGGFILAKKVAKL